MPALGQYAVFPAFKASTLALMILSGVAKFGCPTSRWITELLEEVSIVPTSIFIAAAMISLIPEGGSCRIVGFSRSVDNRHATLRHILELLNDLVKVKDILDLDMLAEFKMVV